MALLLPSLAAMRYTDAHDWYAARKVSVAEALMFVGFDERASTQYRLSDGRTVTWLRDGVATYPAALRSRSLILTVIGDNAALGACTGFVVLLAMSGLLNLARHEPARVLAHRPPAAKRRPGFIEDGALPAYEAPRSTTPTPAMPTPESGRAAPAGAPANGTRPNAAVPSPAPAAKAEPEDAYVPPARPRGRWF